MASVFSAIREHVRSTIEEYATVQSCEDHWHTEERLDLPAAFIGWGGTSYEITSGNQELRIRLPFTVEIEAADLEDVQVAIEQIEAMWIFSNARLTELQAAGGAYIHPARGLYPIDNEEDNCVRGTVDLVLHIIRGS